MLVRPGKVSNVLAAGRPLPEVPYRFKDNLRGGLEQFLKQNGRTLVRKAGGWIVVFMMVRVDHQELNCAFADLHSGILAELARPRRLFEWFLSDPIHHHLVRLKKTSALLIAVASFAHSALIHGNIAPELHGRRCIFARIASDDGECDVADRVELKVFIAVLPFHKSGQQNYDAPERLNRNLDLQKRQNPRKKLVPFGRLLEIVGADRHKRIHGPRKRNLQTTRQLADR
jgi:hypothetical protein